MKIIFRYLKRYWFFALSAPLMMLLEVVMDLMLPATMARIVDEGVASGDLPLVLHLGGWMILFSLTAFVGGSGCAILSSYAATGLGADLRNDLFTRVLSLSHGNLDKLETGNLITRLTNDASQLEEVSMMMLRLMVRAPLQIIGSLVMAILISRQLSSLFLIFIPALLAVIGLLTWKAYPLFFKVQEKLDRLNTRLQENLAGKRLVKAFVREDFETSRFHGVNDELTDVTVHANRTMATANPAMQILLNSAIIAALWFGADLVDLGTLKLGALIAFLGYLRQLLFSLMMVSQLIMWVSRAQASSVRVQEVLNSKPDVQDTAGARNDDSPPTPTRHDNVQGKVEFRNVTFTYRESGDPVLKNLSFIINPGETVAILGATGSGKSSLVNLIPRFYEIDSGEILFGNEPHSEISLKELRQRVAVVPQKTLLFSGTVRDNILYHAPEDQRPALTNRMHQSAEAANIAPFIEGLPKGYDTDVNQRGVNLSGGQKQRIAIARALAKEAPVVIFDDATSAVDTATEKRIRQALRARKGNSTLLIVAQRISSVMEADRIIVLEDGAISGIGTHSELLITNALYREIFESQVDRSVLV